MVLLLYPIYMLALLPSGECAVDVEEDAAMREILSTVLTRRAGRALAMVIAVYSFCCAIVIAILYARVHTPASALAATATEHNDAYPTANFLSAFVPELLIFGGCLSMIAVLFPRDLNDASARKFLVPLAIIGVVVDIAGSALFLKSSHAVSFASGGGDDLEARLRLSIHLALAFVIVAVEDGFVICYLYLIQRHTSWALFRVAMALDAVACLFAIMLLHFFGERHYPPDGRTFATSLSRPAVGFFVAATFNAGTRARLADLGRKAGMQHAIVGLEQLRHCKLPGQHRTQSWSPSGNLCSSTSSFPNSDESYCNAEESSRRTSIRSQASSHHTAKVRCGLAHT